MPGKMRENVKLYRIVHVDNLEYLLMHGMCNREHPDADPDYINIGDNDLIRNRHNYQVRINPPGGELGEYVPFYFGRLSPMLLRIKTGSNGIKAIPQKNIVYIVCKLDTVVGECEEWCFTDGHAKNKITTFYNSLDELNEVYWNKVDQRYWRNTEDDFDMMRHKQAEFLVRFRVPISCIFAFVTYTQPVADHIKKLLEKLELDILVRVNPGSNYYY